MSAKLAALAAMLGAAVLAAPLVTQQAAYNSSSAAIVKPSVVFAFDQERKPAQKSRTQRPQASEPSVIINVFPNMAAPADESEPRPHEAPAASPHRIQSPGERAPSPQPQFSPRLRPPNGKTNGKIYPA